MENETKNLAERIKELLDEKDIRTLKSTLAECDDNLEILQSMEDLSRKEQALVFRLLPKESALFVFEQLEAPLQKELLDSFTDQFASEILEYLDPDDLASLMEEMPARCVKRYLSLLSPEDRKHANMLLGYQTGTAGRLMTPLFISLNCGLNAAQALAKVRKEAKDKETIYYLYVTDPYKKLIGVLSLRKLLTSDEDTLVSDMMYDAIIRVSTDTPDEAVAEAMKDYDLLAIPVVDSEDRIVGIVTVDDAMDIMEQAATDDIYDQAGLANITSKETNRSEVLVRGSLWAIWKVRLPFLVITLLAGIASGSIISFFEDSLALVAGAIIFIPLIMDMGGNVGTQSTTVFVRGIVLGHIKPKQFIRHLLKELTVALSIGVLVGTVAGTIAGLWQWNVMLGLAVGLALVCVMTIAGMLGFLVPFILIKLKLDSAAGSSPLITSIKDIVGLATYFSLVMLFFNVF